MRKLLSMHVDAQATNQNGSNALHIAVKLGHVEVVKEIIRLKNFPVDATKKNGVTAAGIAAFRGNIDMLHILSERVDLHYTNNQGIGAMYLAVKGDKVDSIRYLLGKKVSIYLS